MSVLLAAILASGPTYGIASRDMPELRSRVRVGHAGEAAPVPERDGGTVQLPDTVVPLRLNGTDLVCEARGLGCGLVIKDPDLGLIIVQTPAIPGYFPERTHSPDRHGADLARDLQEMTRTRPSDHPETGQR